MNRKMTSIASVVAVALVSIALADPAAKEAQPAAQQQPAPEMKLPPGWTEADMQAYMTASAPGKMHEQLTRDVGTWEGQTTTWMPGASEGDGTKSRCTSIVTPMMDGRFVKVEVNGEMPGMGMYNGFGLYGFDNVREKFISTWIDNHGTGMMTGTGELSSDGKTLTWNCTAHCPIQKKPVAVREVETITGPNTKTLEMFGPDPKTGKEFRMMKIELTKKA